MFPKIYLLLHLFFIVWYPCKLSLCEQTNEIKRNLVDKNSNKNVQSKNKRKKEENHRSHVLNSLSLPMTTVVLVGEAFHISLHMNTHNHISLHMNTYNNQNKEI